MKRTNLVLREDLLKEAVRVLGTKTYSAAVNLALEEAIRFKKIQSLPGFFGRGLWEGDLDEMRRDRTPRASGDGVKRKRPRR
ncbi:MAG: type II toxin-antitoxin system VapB family antitoxin [Acidobacteria bacterium]|nr:type II toxin-antitoxin system VapB family antitoxin [Acidobacteriota bacterium]